MRAGCKHFRTASGLPANCRQPPNHSSHLFLDGASPHFCSFRIPSGVQSGPLFALPLGKRPPPFLCVWLSIWFMALERWPGGSNLKPLSEVVAQMNMVPVKSCLPLVLLLCHLFCGMKYEVWKIRLPNWVRGSCRKLLRNLLEGAMAPSQPGAPGKALGLQVRLPPSVYVSALRGCSGGSYNWVQSPYLV